MGNLRGPLVHRPGTSSSSSDAGGRSWIPGVRKIGLFGVEKAYFKRFLLDYSGDRRAAGSLSDSKNHELDS